MMRVEWAWTNDGAFLAFCGRVIQRFGTQIFHENTFVFPLFGSIRLVLLGG
jgi:hypothetical protein